MSREMGMRGMARNGMIVALAAGLAAAAAMGQAGSQATTHTTLTTEIREIGGRSVTTYSATVLDDDGLPATGAVTLMERGQGIAGGALNSEGKTEIRFDGLSAGNHSLSAVYAGDAKHTVSESENVEVTAQASPAPSFALSISAATMAIAAPGQTGTLVATITPAGGFTGFISLSCSGPPISSGAPGGAALPIGVSCIFTPANLQITSAAKTATAQMSLQTTAPAGQNAQNRAPNSVHGGGSPLVLAVLLPGVIGLGFLGRKRNLFGRTALLLMVGTISLLGATACSARYSYFKHPPTANDGTPPGTYQLTVTAQTSDGVTASSQDQTLTLTVK